MLIAYGENYDSTQNNLQFHSIQYVLQTVQKVTGETKDPG